MNNSAKVNEAANEMAAAALYLLEAPANAEDLQYRRERLRQAVAGYQHATAPKFAGRTAAEWVESAEMWEKRAKSYGPDMVSSAEACRHDAEKCRLYAERAKAEHAAAP